MSQQLALSSIASVLAVAYLCLAAASLERAAPPAYDSRVSAASESVAGARA